MGSLSALDHAETLVSQGRFSEASAYLNSHTRDSDPTNSDKFRLLRAETALALGDIRDAERAARSIQHHREPELQARAYRVLAACSFDGGDLSETVQYLREASTIAKHFKLNEQQAKVEVAQFLIASAFQSIDTALAALPDLRRVVLRVADPHLIIELRLVVAKAEARRHSLLEAERHHDAAARLLADFPNVWIEGRLNLDRSIVSTLLGDFQRSIEFARLASECAEKSGHFHTRLAAAINMSHLLEFTGEVGEAELWIQAALRCAGENRHLMRAALDSWANLLIRTGRFAESRLVIDEAARRAEGDAEGRPHWDAIAELYSRARLAEAERRWTDAATELGTALSLANQCGDEFWRSRLQLSRARCLAFDGQVDAATHLLVTWQGASPVLPEWLAHYYSAVGATYRSKDESRARSYVARALRISGEMGNTALQHSLATAFDPPLRTGDPAGADVPLPPDLDTAAALLELGAHPHILARETFTAIKDAGCAEAVAVVVAARDAPRIVETHGWSEREAARAQADDTSVVMDAGAHRDEMWQVVARAKPGIDDHCTLAALGRIVAAAVALENYRRAEKQRAALWPPGALDGDEDGIWASEQMSDLLALARRVAPTPVSVLLTGETGTGKEMLARAIHRASNRADRVFLPFNCAAVPRDMLESQLFGYRRGAFTGADTAFPGVIRSAAGGTLFLDEIGEIPVDLQAKLLRFLETHEIHPIGEPQPLTVDVRVIAATNARVEELMSAGRFRDDLFYRLNVLRLNLPPLRERREEIPSLAQHYLRRHADELKKGTLSLDDETLEYLVLYPWPGNVRQLANEVRRMVALAEPDATLTPAMLSPEVQASRRTIAASTDDGAEVRIRLDQPMPAAVEMLERMMVNRALDRSRGKVEEASRLLGISRKGLFLKRRRWGLPRAS